MFLNSQAFSEQAYIKYRATRTITNDANSFGIEVQVNKNAVWKVIGIHHLTSTENSGNHHLYIDVLDKHGKKYDSSVWLRYGIDGMEPILQQTSSTHMNEPVATHPLFLRNPVSVSVAGLSSSSNEASDRILNIHTGHPAEGGDNGNSFNHHSFFVVFMAVT